jgi:nicotinamidase-related amidase
MADILMVIDAQDYWANKNPETTQKITDAVNQARARGMQVVWCYAQEGMHGDKDFTPTPAMQVGTGSLKELFNGSAKFKYDPVIQPKAGEWVIGKGPNQTDAFTNPHLEKFLKDQKPDNIYAVGFMSGYCVHDTVMSGARAGLPMAVMSDLVADDKDKIEAPENFKSDGVRTTQSANVFRPPGS